MKVAVDAPDLLLDAVISRDPGRLAGALADEVVFRASTPIASLEKNDVGAVVRCFDRWFGSATDIEVLDTSRSEVGRRTRLSWRLRVHLDVPGHEGWHVIEQTCFARTEGDQISDITLACSGFQPIT